MPVQYPFADSPTLVTTPSLFLGPGPIVILAVSLIDLAVGMIILRQPQEHRCRTLAKLTIALNLVAGLISAYYAISLAKLPHEIILPGRSIGIQGAGSGLSLIGVGLMVALLSGVIGVVGGAMVIKICQSRD